VSSASPAPPGGRVALFSAPTAAELVVAMRRGAERTDGGPARAAVVDPTPARVERALSLVERGAPWRGRDGVWFSPKGLLAGGGTLAFLFPGVDTSFEPRVDDVARHFGMPEPAGARSTELQDRGVGIIGVNRLLDAVLRKLGVAPSDVAGHSIGEWSGMIATGVIREDEVDRFIATLEPGTLRVPGVVFASAGCGVEKALAAIEGLSDVALSHDNCPHQVVLCGAGASIDAALSRLEKDGILCQRLPFQSGFHTPLFSDYVDPHRTNFERLSFRAPRATFWSATTCAPYPREPDAIRALAVEHLVKPVRFRELVERLYERGTRVFVQVGVGSLVHFVEDSLRGRPHAAIASNVKERSGLDQLRRVLAALFVEGAKVDFSRVTAPETRSSLPPGHPVLAEFLESMSAIVEAEREVLARFAAVQQMGPRETETTRELSVEAFPELSDHSFVRQPPGWPTLSDREPVVPMTTLVELMIEHASPFRPGRVAIGLEEVRAHRWLVVAPPVRVAIRCRSEGRDRVRVTIGEYCEGTVVFADRYPTPPPPDDAPLARSARAPVDARSLYEENWLFHGRAFQGVVDVGILGEDAIRGTLEAGRARGALLDNAGQLFGYWVMTRHENDRMAMPVRLARVRLFAPHPEPGRRLVCTVRVRSVDERSVVGDLSLTHDGRVWATVEGWENRRIETDDRLWSVIRWPEKNVLSEVTGEGFALFEDRYRAGATRERIARRFLGEPERAEYERQTPRRKRSWLAGRIAAKDAVRALLWRLGHGPLFPVEITIANEPSGRPVVRTNTGRALRVSIAHKGDVAVAMACEERSVGIDIERIESRGDSFAEVSFTADELRLVRDEPRDEAWTRLWSAKEAAAKAAGTGLLGSPVRFPVRDRIGERLLVGEEWVTTKRHGDFIIGWTEA
jgi:acyl transferase domain-containing protein